MTDRPNEPTGRLRFVDFRAQQSNDGRSVISVVLQRRSGERVTGTAECDGSDGKRLECAANAMINAPETGAGLSGGFDLLGVKEVKAFDTSVIIVAISAKPRDEVQRLVGSCLVGASPEYGAAVAVLNATHRSVGSVFAS